MSQLVSLARVATDDLATGTPNGGVPADAVDDIETRLARLADLEARRVISADEAAARRAAILEEI